jgi:CheY-specific phosphatase CheX
MPEPIAAAALERALGEAVTEIMEKMFFIRILEDVPAAESVVEDGVEYAPDPSIGACVNFHGEPSGRLSLDLKSAAARSIAADFLGEEPPALEQRQVEEVFCELANMICGALLSRVESRIPFRLDSPEVADRSTDVPETVMRIYPIGDSDLAVRIWMEAGESAPGEPFAPCVTGY